MQCIVLMWLMWVMLLMCLTGDGKVGVGPKVGHEGVARQVQRPVLAHLCVCICVCICACVCIYICVSASVSLYQVPGLARRQVRHVFAQRLGVKGVPVTVGGVASVWVCVLAVCLC